MASGEVGGSAGAKSACPVICGTYLTGVYVRARPACPVASGNGTGVGRNYRTGVGLWLIYLVFQLVFQVNELSRIGRKVIIS